MFLSLQVGDVCMFLRLQVGDVCIFLRLQVGYVCINSTYIASNDIQIATLQSQCNGGSA